MEESHHLVEMAECYQETTTEVLETLKEFAGYQGEVFLLGNELRKCDGAKKKKCEQESELLKNQINRIYLYVLILNRQVYPSFL